jgi:hypothetical protein
LLNIFANSKPFSKRRKPENTGPRWDSLMTKSRGKKSHCTVPFQKSVVSVESRGWNFSQLRSSTGSHIKIDAQFSWQNSMPFSDRDRSLKQVLTYEVGSKQNETRQIFQQLRPIEELCKNKNYGFLYKSQVAFSLPTSPVIGLGSSAGDRRSIQALQPGPPSLPQPPVNSNPALA